MNWIKLPSGTYLNLDNVTSIDPVMCDMRESNSENREGLVLHVRATGDSYSVIDDPRDVQALIKHLDSFATILATTSAVYTSSTQTPDDMAAALETEGRC